MRIVLGVTGGIAAYKSLEVLRGFTKAGHEVETVVTQNAFQFVGKASFEALSGNKCHSDLYEDAAGVPHVALAKTDLVVVAPATASFIAKYAHGIADDLLLNVLLATTARVVIAPAMHTEMWRHPATVHNVEILRSRGVEIIEPEFGELTSGDTGQGRLAESKVILSTALSAPAMRQGQHQTRVVITAGGTREPIDEVRYLGNSSSGLQGIELSKAFSANGYLVTLIGANISNPHLTGVEFVPVKTHSDLAGILSEIAPEVLVMAAAVSDFSISPRAGKIRRSENLTLSLEPTTDLVADFANRNPNCAVVAFAAEDVDFSQLAAVGHAKLKRKRVTAVVANNISAIGSDFNEGFVVTSEGERHFSGTKSEVSQQILRALQDLNVIP